MTSPEIIQALITVARTAHALADNTEESAKGFTVWESDFKEMSAALDVLDELPDPPGEAATGPRKAEYWLEKLCKP